jgi:hypothetical protein
MKIFIGSLSSFSSSFAVLPIAFEQRDNSMSLVLVRDAAAKYSSFFFKKKMDEKKGTAYIQRTRGDFLLHVTLNGWDVALFSPLSLTLCPLE